MPITTNELPGPKGLPIIGNLHLVKFSSLHAYLENKAREFGDVFKIRLGPTKLIVVSKPELIHQILKARPASFRRMSKIDKIVRNEGIHGLFNAEGEDWKVHRRIVTRGLDLKHQQQFFPAMKGIVERLYGKLDSIAESKKAYAIHDDLTKFTVDVTTSLAFGIDMNTLEQKGGVIQDHMEKIFPMIFKRINLPVPLYKFFKTKADKEYSHALQEIEKQVLRFIETGKQKVELDPALKEKPSNILESFIVAAGEEQGISEYEIKGNLLTLLMAGEDTTAHALTWAIYLICLHPEIQEKLQEEADQVLMDDVYLHEYSKHDQLIYTNGVIHETLRLKSVAPVMLVEPLEDIEMDQYKFNKGSKIVLLTRAAGLREEYFSESEKMLPERWSNTGPSKCPVHNLSGFLPFGSGPRLCPGKNLAILEMKLVLSMIAKNFQIELVEPKQHVEEKMAFTMMPGRFEIILKSRNYW